MSAESTVTEKPKHPWEKLGYEPVLGLTDRIISRYLRSQRKNMYRLFMERGLLDFADRLQQIRKSRQGMLAKNRMFQKVLDEYAKRIAPPGAAEVPAFVPEAAPEVSVEPRSETMGMQPNAISTEGLDTSDGARAFACGGVQGLEDGDDPLRGIVVEE